MKKNEPLIQTWKRIIVGVGKSWVLFEHGTCVVFVEPTLELDLKQQALELLTEWGPVHVGGPAGDFSTIELSNHPGWVVTSHHDDILTYVGSNEAGDDDRSDLAVGLLGRERRDRDSKELNIIHVQDNR